MSFALQLLEFIKETGDSMAEFILTPPGQFRLVKKPTYYGTLRRLESRKLIVRRQKNKQVFFQITPQGLKLVNKSAKRIKRSDGLSTIVMFDIPEEKHRQRNILRRFLIRNGYTLIQKSVLISPDKVVEGLIDLIGELKLNTDVNIISGKIDHIP